MTAENARVAAAAALPPLGSAQQPERLKAFLAHERPPPAKPPTHTTNDISDIAGARPLLKDHVYVNKPHFHEPNDIPGSCSKELHPKHRRVGSDDRFKQLHIEGATPDTLMHAQTLTMDLFVCRILASTVGISNQPSRESDGARVQTPVVPGRAARRSKHHSSTLMASPSDSLYSCSAHPQVPAR
ncbi:hypothetical protein PINS_up006170 [Pythium insidiosum]|nr:hypothetical protein PINS_up006170 [Pythium insidiosum]